MAWLAGAALVTLGLLALAYVRVPLERASLALVVVVVAALGLWLERRRRPEPVRAAPGGLPAAAPFVAVAALALAVGVFEAFRLGDVTHVDYQRAWGKKAVALFLEHDLDFANLRGPHRYYPLEVSNLFGSVHIVVGHVNDAVVRVPGAMFGLAIAATLWWLLRPLLPPAGAAAAVALAVTPPVFVTSMTNGLADLPAAAYVTVCVLAALLWVRDGGAGWAPLSGFAAGAAGWTKLEGALTCLVVLAGVLVLRRAVRTPGIVVWLAWWAVFVIPWQVFQRIHDIPFNQRHFETLFLDVAWIAEHVARTLLETSMWGVFWPLCIGLVVVSAPLWWRSEWRDLAVLTLPNVVITAGAYVTHYRTGQEGSVEATAHRLYLHVAPSVAAMAAVGAVLAWAAWREPAAAAVRRRRDRGRPAPVGGVGTADRHP